jgi:hypothetical protein
MGADGSLEILHPDDPHGIIGSAGWFKKTEHFIWLQQSSLEYDFLWMAIIFVYP